MKGQKSLIRRTTKVRIFDELGGALTDYMSSEDSRRARCCFPCKSVLACRTCFGSTQAAV